uniref:DNA-directed RNA polymerase n=1 Tax=viral metagenome TaxID=1070528 RepID=A0A6C0B8V6_9ZZZZ
MEDPEDFSEPEDLESDNEIDPTKPKIASKIKSIDEAGASEDEFDSELEYEIDAEDLDIDLEDEVGSVSDINEEERAKLNIPHFDEIEDDEDDDEDEDENYLQKFDENMRKNIIADYHPEMISHNYSEIEVMSRVVRDENGVVIDPLHKTLPFVTRYEKARILGERAKQINAGAKPFVEIADNIIDGYLIALKEFDEKKIPFIVKRPLPGGGIEYWKFRDLEVLV